MKLIDKKIAFIVDYLKENKYIDILNSDFVDSYIEEFNVSYKPTFYGAYKCKDIGNTLRYGYNKGVFNRSISGLTGLPWGFPRWVYVYSLKK